MKNLIVLFIFVALAWKGYEHYHRNRVQAATQLETAFDADAANAPDIDVKSASRSRFACDGRTHCSQMTSCEEATYFIEHCPDVKMDGNHDGVPCEQQWCN